MANQDPEVMSGQHFYDGLHPVDHENAPQVVSYVNHNTAPEVISYVNRPLPAYLPGKPSPASSFGEKELYVIGDGAATSTGGTSKLWKRKRLVIAGAIAGVIVIIAATVAGVVGSKAVAANKAVHSSVPASTTSAPASASATPSLTPADAAAPVKRVKSTSGAWNGTGMTCYQSTVQDWWGALVYQDYTGQITELRWNYSTNGNNITSVGTKQVTNKAADNTNMVTAAYDMGGWWRFQMVYVDQNNNLADLWSSNQALNSPWTDGNLSTHNFKAANDTPAPLSMIWSDHWYAGEYGPSATRLFAGGAPDGQVHQYTLFQDNGTWSNNDYVLAGSYGSGAVYSNGGFNDPGQPNTTVWNAQADGTWTYYMSNDGVNNFANPNVTTGINGKYADPVKATLTGKSAQTAKNGSVVPWWGNVGRDTNEAWGKGLLGLIYEDGEGKLGSVGLDQAQLGAAEFTGANAWLQQYDIMPGTQFATCGGDQWTQVLFYQTTGNDISWLIIRQTEILNNGTLHLYR